MNFNDVTCPILPYYLYECEIEFPEGMHYTFIPERVKGVGLVYPSKISKGWRWGCEISEAKEWDAKITIFRVLKYKLVKFAPFRTYIEELYKLKEKASIAKDPIKGFYKLLLNSLYGKFG